MGNIVGPVWGEQAAQYIAQGNQMRLQEEMQARALEQQSKMKALDLMTTFVAGLAQGGGEASEEAMNTLAQAASVVLKDLGVGELTSEQLASISKGMMAPETQVARETIPSAIEQKKAESRQAVAGAQIEEIRAANTERELQLRMEEVEQKIFESGAREELIGEQTITEREKRTLIPGEVDLLKKRGEYVDAQTAKLESETVDLSLNQKAVQKRIEYLEAMTRQADATAQKILDEIPKGQTDQMLSVMKDLQRSLAETDNPAIAQDVFIAHLLKLQELGFDFPLKVASTKQKTAKEKWLQNLTLLLDDNGFMKKVLIRVFGTEVDIWSLIMDTPGARALRKQQGTPATTRKGAVDPSTDLTGYSPDMFSPLFLNIAPDMTGYPPVDEGYEDVDADRDRGIPD